MGQHRGLPGSSYPADYSASAEDTSSQRNRKRPKHKKHHVLYDVLLEVLRYILWFGGGVALVFIAKEVIDFGGNGGGTIDGTVSISDSELAIRNLSSAQDTVAIAGTTGDGEKVPFNLTDQGFMKVNWEGDIILNVDNTTVNGIQISVIDSNIEELKGSAAQGTTSIVISGHAENMPSNSTWIVSPLADASTYGQLDDNLFKLIPTTLTVLCDSAEDAVGGSGANSVMLTGLNSDYGFVSEVVYLNGTYTSSVPFMRLTTATVHTAGTLRPGTNVGDIYIVTAGEGRSGSLARIPAGIGASRTAMYTIPAGKVGAIRQIKAVVQQNSFSAQYRSTLHVYSQQQSAAAISEVSMALVEGTLDNQYLSYLGPFEEKTDLYMTLSNLNTDNGDTIYAYVYLSFVISDA